MRIHLIIVRATLRVVRTAPLLSHAVRDATRVPNQRLHLTAAAQPPVAQRPPVNRGLLGGLGLLYKSTIHVVS